MSDLMGDYLVLHDGQWKGGLRPLAAVVGRAAARKVKAHYAESAPTP